MFLSNSYSFLLVRSAVKKQDIQSDIAESAIILPSSSLSDSRRNLFLPSSHSFLLAKSIISKPVIQTAIAEPATSLSRLRESNIPLAAGQPSSLSDSGKPTIGDKNKRTFLKMAGIAGAGLVGSLLLPKKADALIMGSSPTTGGVGVKNASNARINPAREETLGGVLKTGDLALTGGVLEVKVTSVSGAGSTSFSEDGVTATTGMVDAQRHVQVDVLTSALPSTASKDETLQTISYGGVQYALRLATVGDIDYVGEAVAGKTDADPDWRIKRITSSASGITIEWAYGSAGLSNAWDDGVNNYADWDYL